MAHQQIRGVQPDNEHDFQRWLSQNLREYGWTVEREYSPDSTSERIDLLLTHDHYPTVGVECKYFRDGDGGGKMAKTQKQILRYWRKEFGGGMIQLWAFCPYYSTDSEFLDHSEFCRDFMNKWGIGYMDPSRLDVVIDYDYSKKWAKIPAFTNNRDHSYMDQYEDSVSVPRIEKRVEGRLPMEYRGSL